MIRKFTLPNKTSLKYSKRMVSNDVSRPFYDIIISGGGMVGQTMACALSKNRMLKKKSVLLIESSPKKGYVTPESYSNRVSSIVPSTKNLFLELGMWKHINRFQEVKEMKIWGSYSQDYVHFLHDAGNPAYIVENDEIIKAASLENSSAKNVTIINGKTISHVKLSSTWGQQHHEIHLNDNTVLNASLLIGADGANSSIRNAMEANYISWKYNQFGIVATLVIHSDFENTTAWQKFLPDGPIALLPLKNGLSSLVWSVTEKKAKDLLQLPEEIFVNALNEALSANPIKNSSVKKFSDLTKTCIKNNSTQVPLIPPYIVSIVSGSRASFPLAFGHSSLYVKNRVALIGDSAHKVHPLAGQGVNIGFRDIRCLNEKLTEGLIDGRPLGHIRDLHHYETEAQRKNIPIMAAIDLFHRVYTSKYDLIRALGNSCFHFAESIPPVKSIMKNLATS